MSDLGDYIAKLYRMRDIAIKLNDLDFMDEADLRLLDSLQIEQANIRIVLDPHITQIRELPEGMELLKDCIDLEIALAKKLTDSRAWAEEQILKVQMGARSKHIYNNNYVQAEGYFIDNKK